MRSLYALMLNMANRKQGDEFYVSNVNKTSPCAKVNSVVKAISPMKKAKTCSYVDGKITDGKAKLRVFGFDAGVRRKLVELEKNNEPVQLTNCEIQKSRHEE